MGGHKQSFVGEGAPGLIVATTLATTTKNDNPVGNFVNSRRRVARNSQWEGCFGVLGAEPPALENFAFFCKNNFILELFSLNNNAFKTWVRNWQCKQD